MESKSKNLAIIVCLVVAVAMLFAGCSQTNNTEIKNKISPEEAKEKAVNYANENLVKMGEVKGKSVEDKGAVYKVECKYKDKPVSMFITVDGEYLFLQAFNLSKEVTSPTPTETPIPKEKLKAFVGCLEKEGVEIYGRSGCSYCAEQLEILGGKEIAEPIYNDCANESVNCSDIEGTPTTVINGEKYEGVMNIDSLSKATNCTLH